MRKVHVFDNVSLDGYFVDAGGDMSWAHRHDEEWNAFMSRNAGGDAALLFGRVTYQMMASFWPTPQAAQLLPDVAKGMNGARKYVASRTLEAVSWENTTLLKGDLVTEISMLKAENGPDLVILGSGQVVSQLTAARLIDSYQIVLNPIVLGAGRTLFETIGDRQSFALTKTQTFRNGNVVLWYQPA